MISCIFGKRGSGKTTLAKSLLRDYRRIIAIDPLGEYSGDRYASSLLLGYSLCGVGRTQAFRRTLFPRDLACIDKTIQLASIMGNCLLLIEECDLICSANFVPEHFSDSIRRGRHYNVDLLCISRRPSELPRLLTSQADLFYIFRFSEPLDLQYFSRTFGDLTADRINNLVAHQHIIKAL